ncbi:hypothetical protein KAX75_07380 [candidate division WOR-3 bacterium]|nr:hypothetical protein [candidate division WOR-3 bacterium]
MKWYVGIIIGLLFTASIHAQEIDIYGYFEPQYSGMYFDDSFHQFVSDKFRLDLKSTEVKHTEFGANMIYLLYFGKKDWNILDFLPEDIVSTIPPEMQPLYQFSFKDTLYLDNIYVRFALRRFAVTIGKQQISFGTGYFANPTDVFNTKDMLDPTYEQRGHNGIRTDFLFQNRLSLVVLYAPIEDTWKHSGKLVRLKTGIGHFDVSALFNEMYHVATDFYTLQVSGQRRRIVGMDFVGELLGFGVWGEGAYNIMENDEDFHEFIVGGDYTFDNNFYTLVEYHCNSQAKSNSEEYDLNDWMRLFTGEAKTISRDQVYSFVRYPVNDLLSIGSSFIVSISDKSTAIVPSIEYSLFENIDLTVLLNFYTGEEGTAFSSSLGNGGFLRACVYF